MFQRIALLTPVLMLSLIMQTDLALADEDRGLILKTTGVVKIVNAQGGVREVTGSEAINESDTVSTGEGGQAVVKFNDGALSILDENSILKVEKKNWLSHIGGKIYFTFRKVFSGSQQVKAKFSTIGIRGTTFIVTDNEDEGQSVALQEGKLEIESPGDDYEIHRQRPVKDFESFKREAAEAREALQKEYEGYKKKTMEEFVEYKKSFSMEANHVIRFDGNRVDEAEMGEQDAAAFSDFEAVAGDMLESFRRQSQEHGEQQEEKQKEEIEEEKPRKGWRHFFD
ncbi:MAG: FecR family protein [Gammaproteobacteria bacterium]|nr:FecR family protein [Gammaproteobacteria bacterium]